MLLHMPASGMPSCLRTAQHDIQPFALQDEQPSSHPPRAPPLQIRNLSPTPEPKEATPEPAQAFAGMGAVEPASTAEQEREKTPDLTITGALLMRGRGA